MEPTIVPNVTTAPPILLPVVAFFLIMSLFWLGIWVRKIFELPKLYMTRQQTLAALIFAFITLGLPLCSLAQPKIGEVLTRFNANQDFDIFSLIIGLIPAFAMGLVVRELFNQYIEKIKLNTRIDVPILTLGSGAPSTPPSIPIQ